MDELSERQLQLLDTFKKQVSDIHKPEFDDRYYTKWLIAREWDLKKSEKMLRDSLAWRKQFGTDSVLTDWQIPEHVRLYNPGGYFGTDKLGHPVWYELLGLVDLKGMIYSMPKKDIVRFRIYNTEYLFKTIFPECSKKAGKCIDKCVFIVDLEGIGLRHIWKPAIDIYTELLAIVEANYPEALYKAYIINAPKIFPLLYSIVKPFLAPNTREKIEVYGANYKEVLLRDFDADQLPAHYGGTATDPDGDPYCKSKICRGGTVPDKYRMDKTKKDNVNTDNFSQTTVGKGSFVDLDYNVTEAGSVLNWNFWTNDKDIGFGIYSRNGTGKESKLTEVVANQRVNSHLVPESDTFVCEKPGTYVVRFDNSYSWVNTKKVYYLIEVVAPDAMKELHVESTNL